MVLLLLLLLVGRVVGEEGVCWKKMLPAPPRPEVYRVGCRGLMASEGWGLDNRWWVDIVPGIVCT